MKVGCGKEEILSTKYEMSNNIKTQNPNDQNMRRF
jgi:hypothetical protein